MDKIKKMDFYRRVPVDLTEPTAPGAIISILCGVVMILLFLGEVKDYMFPGVRSDMFVAPDEGQGSKLKVNFNMTFHKLPCFAFSLDVVDVLGRHEVNVLSNTVKSRVGPGGEHTGVFTDHEQDFEHQKFEGCNAAGFIMVNKVPGNFHVSSHGLGHVVARYLGGHINVQHTIHHLSFGDVELLGVTGHGYEGEVHPLNAMQQVDEATLHYEYFLDVVPTVYAKGRGKVQRGYQFTANMHKQGMPPGGMAAAFFRYQLSPITVKYTDDHTSFLHFLTYVCAIIGGVFTVSGIASRMIHTTAVQFQRRLMGKDQ